MEKLKAYYESLGGLQPPVIDKDEYAETSMPRYVKPFEELLIPEIVALEDRLATTLPGFIEGENVVLIGCSEGRAAFLLSAMVGPEGHVFAFDPDGACIERARFLVPAQTAALGYESPNIEFAQGYGEKLPLGDGSVGVVICNALFNISPDQGAILDEALRVLKEGGEFCLTSVFAGHNRLAQIVRASDLLKANYLSEALYSSDIRRMFSKRGINSVRYVEKRAFNSKALCKNAPKIVRKELKRAKLYYGCLRTFKLDDLEDSCENYKLVVTYNGSAPGHEQFFDLDDTHRFFVDSELEVCGNTFAFCTETRFAKFFDKEGTRDFHYGIYDYCEYCGGGTGAKIKGRKERKKLSFTVSSSCAECASKDCVSCE